jgi:hypothetical protein
MTLCPIAIVASCRKCPAFGVCPLKTILGDEPKVEVDGRTVQAPAPKPGAKSKKQR